MSTNEKFAASVRDRMAVLGWTQQDLANALGVHQVSVSQVLNCRRCATLNLVDKYAAVLGVDAKELILSKPKKPSKAY